MDIFRTTFVVNGTTWSFRRNRRGWVCLCQKTGAMIAGRSTGILADIKAARDLARAGGEVS